MKKQINSKVKTTLFIIGILFALFFLFYGARVTFSEGTPEHIWCVNWIMEETYECWDSHLETVESGNINFSINLDFESLKEKEDKYCNNYSFISTSSRIIEYLCIQNCELGDSDCKRNYLEKMLYLIKKDVGGSF
jgi:hypothetical protein